MGVPDGPEEAPEGLLGGCKMVLCSVVFIVCSRVPCFLCSCLCSWRVVALVYKRLNPLLSRPIACAARLNLRLLRAEAADSTTKSDYSAKIAMAHSLASPPFLQVSVRARAAAIEKAQSDASARMAANKSDRPSAPSTLHDMSISVDMTSDDRQMLAAQLGDSGYAYKPSETGGIFDIMHEEMTDCPGDAADAEHITRISANYGTCGILHDCRFQTTAASTVYDMSLYVGMTVDDRLMLASSLSGEPGCAPNASKYVGILEAEKNELIAMLGDNAKMAAIEEIAVERTEAINALQKAINSMLAQISGAENELVITQNDVSVSISADMTADDRQKLASLSGESGYVPRSSKPVSILETMKEEMTDSPGDAVDAEYTGGIAFKQPAAVTLKEVNALQEAIGSKLLPADELVAKTADAENDRDDTKVGHVVEKSNRRLIPPDDRCFHSARHVKFRGHEGR